MNKVRNSVGVGFLVVASSMLTATPSKAQVDPVTVGMAVTAINSLFSKDATDPSMELLQANRELLIGLHGRLDGIEASLAKVLIQVAQLPQEMFTQNLNAQTYAIGSKITAIGQNYLTSLSSLEYDRQVMGSGSDRFEGVLNDFRIFLANNIQEVSLLGTDLMQRDNSSNINALTVVAASFIELSMRIELEARFNASIGDIFEGAKKYTNHVAKILDADHAESLSVLIDSIKSAIENDSALNSWKRKVENPNEAEWTPESLVGEYQTSCATEEILRPYNTTCPETRIRREARSESQQYTIQVPCTKDRWETRGTLESALTIDFDGDVGGYPILTAKMEERPFSGAGCPIAKDRFVKFRAGINTTKKDVDILLSKALVLSTLLAAQDASRAALSRLEQVAAGDFTAISAYQVRELDRINIIDVMLEINDLDRLEAIRGTEPYITAMLEEQERIRVLIAAQDERIKVAIEEAAEAAKWNRTLGYLRMAASAYHVYHYVDTSLSSEENSRQDFIDTTDVIKNALLEDIGRQPATEKVLGVLDELLSQAKLWGGLINTQRQLEEMDIQRKKISASLGAGESQSYDIVVVGDRFWAFIETGADRLYPGGARTIGTEVITGE